MEWWSVYVRAAIETEAVLDVQDRLGPLNEALEPFAAAVSGNGQGYDAQLSVTAVDARAAAIRAAEVFEKAAARVALPAGRLVALEVLTEAEFDARRSEPVSVVRSNTGRADVSGANAEDVLRPAGRRSP